MIAPTLTTERLTIAPMTLVHWEVYAAAWADPEMTAFIGGQPRSRTESWGKFLQNFGLWELFGYGFWGIFDREGGRFIGNAGLAQFERGVPQLVGYPEAGWAFIPNAWGKGYATETMDAVFRWADAALEVPEIRCIIDDGNEASQRVAAKLGFEFIGVDERGLGHPINVYSRKSAG